MMWLSPARRYAVNAFIATVLFILLIDTLPQSPQAVRMALDPWLVRLGIRQSVWNLFAPEPDHVNTRLKAEITYRDGEKRQWNGPDWSQASAWEKWAGHRHFEWYDHITVPANSVAWEPWCRNLARTQRPELPDADRGAEVRVVYQDSAIPPAADKPWHSLNQREPFDEGWVLTIEKFD